MAINLNPDLACAANWSKAPHHPVVAFIRDQTIPGAAWNPRCAACLQELANDPDPVFVDVVYLDPIRQRRPSTADDVLAALNRDGYAIVDRDGP
jgi:hypothetical protein